MPKRHVVVLGLDGVRPAAIGSQDAPNLHRLMREGAAMRRHISVFPSETRVNLASLVTGASPAGHGTAANGFLLDGVDGCVAIDPGSPGDAGRLARDGGTLLAETVADRLARAGRRLAILSTGSRGSFGLLTAGKANGAIVAYNPRFVEDARPSDFGARLASRYGAGPSTPDEVLSSAVVDAFIEEVWPETRPAVSIIWLAETDNALHYRGGPGSPGARQALANVDALLGRLLDWRAAQADASEIDLMIVSDHGHVTMTEAISAVDALNESGVRAGVMLGPDVDIAVRPGRTIGLWTRGGDIRALTRAMDALAERPWFGAAFSAPAEWGDALGRVPYTFSQTLVGAGGRRAPHLQIALSASDDTNGFGVPGVGPVDPGTMGLRPGCGMHGGLHETEMRCLCIAHGAAFKAGIASSLPSSTQDIAPTAFRALGLAADGDRFEGRALTEILATTGDGGDLDTASKDHALDLAGRRFTLRQRFVEGRSYLDVASDGA